MKNKITRLQVMMNGVLVGYLDRVTAGGLCFQYDNSWLENSYARPVSLSLPLSTRVYAGDNVYNFFDNLLPDNPAIRAKIQARFQVSTDHPFDLLSFIGRDCIGAIQLITEKGVSKAEQMSYRVLKEGDIARLIENYNSAPLGMWEGVSDFRISLAGAQEKMALLHHDGHWCLPQGSTPTSHIFKLPIGMIAQQNIDLSDSCENEWLCSKIIDAFGIAIAPCEIQTFAGHKVLVVERFDRRYSADGSWLMRLPQEDMCQALGVSPQLKYQAEGGPGILDAMQLLLGSCRARIDRETFFRSQVVFWLLAAIDGHAKNYSLHLLPGGRYQLAPLYDVLSAYPMINGGQLQQRKIKMAMALSGKNTYYHWHRVQHRHFISTAKQVKFSTRRATQIIDEVVDNIEPVISTVSAQLPKDFPPQMASATFEGMRSFKRRLISP